LTPTIGGHSVNATCRRCRRRERTWQGGPPACSCADPDFDPGRGATTARDAFIAFLSRVMRECLRVLKPGAFGLVWALPRTSHWTATALEEAGFEIRDVIYNIFCTGFPKSKSSLKPAVENWFKVQKPLSHVFDWRIMVESTNLLEALLWLRAPASLVERLMKLRQADRPREQGTARWIATILSALPLLEKSEKMAMFSSPEEGLTFWNIASLWRGIWEESCAKTSMFTIGMASNLTTACATLNCFLSAIIPASIIQGATSPNGLLCSACPVASSLKDEKAKWQNIHGPSATALVMAPVLRILVNAAESLSLTIAMKDGVFVLPGAPTGSDANSENWILVKKPGKLQPLGIDECRIAGVVPSVPQPCGGTGGIYGFANGVGRSGEMSQPHLSGRWPANLCLAHVPPDEKGQGGCAEKCVAGCPIRELDEQSGTRKSAIHPRSTFPTELGQASDQGINKYHRDGHKDKDDLIGYGDTGGASRFFATFGYFPKASRSNRGEGNRHPTVKSTRLMEWLVRLVCRTGGVVLDPFMGSGSTLAACLSAGRQGIGIEMDEGYYRIAHGRCFGGQPCQEKTE
jgi:DNA modification methylase